MAIANSQGLAAGDAPIILKIPLALPEQHRLNIIRSLTGVNALLHFRGRLSNRLYEPDIILRMIIHHLSLFVEHRLKAELFGSVICILAKILDLTPRVPLTP